MESGIKVKLMNAECLLINAYLLNLRGGSLFQFGSNSIEDYCEIRLGVANVDIESKTIIMKPVNQEFKHHLFTFEYPTLFRRAALDRMEWCIKVKISAKSNGHTPVQVRRKGLCTIVAADTQLTNEKSDATSCVSTFDMQLFYDVWEPPTILNHTPISFEIKALHCSYSYLFARIDGDKHYSYGDFSIHSKVKRQYLLDAAAKAGLKWSERFWTFDLVLHWLTLGSDDECDGVIGFLLEHENMNGGKSRTPSLNRFYHSTISEFDMN